MAVYATIKKELRKKSAIFAIGFLPAANAQGLTLETSSIPADYQTMALIALRYILVIALMIVGLKAAKAGYDWYYWEGSAAKAVESKEKFSKLLVYICVLFFLLALYRAFVPELGLLTV